MEEEILVVSYKDEDLLQILDSSSLTVLSSFVENSSSTRQAICCLENAIISAQSNKTLLHYYRIGKDIPDRKSSTLEKTTALACHWPWAIAGGCNGTISIWEVYNGELLHTWKKHMGSVNSVYVNEAVIVSAAEDATLKVWEIGKILLSNYEPEYTLAQHTQGISHVYVDWPIIISASLDKTVNVYQMGQQVMNLHTSSPQLCVIYYMCNGSMKILSGGQDGVVTSFHADNYNYWNLEKGPIQSIQMTKFGQVAIGCNLVLLVNPEDGSIIRQIQTKAPIQCMIISPRLQEESEPVRILKRSIEEAPTNIRFTGPGNTELQEETPEQAPADASRAEEINSQLYKFWVQHWVQ